MYTIDIDHRIAAPIEKVFAAVADHEHFFRGPEFEYCRIIREGQGNRGGLGAMREIVVRGMKFQEEITRFEPPTCIDYVIRSLTTKGGWPIPSTHDGGWMRFSEGGGGTVINWRSRFSSPIPLLGRLLEIPLGRTGARVFRRLLAQLEAELTCSAVVRD